MGMTFTEMGMDSRFGYKFLRPGWKILCFGLICSGIEQLSLTPAPKILRSTPQTGHRFNNG